MRDIILAIIITTDLLICFSITLCIFSLREIMSVAMRSCSASRMAMWWAKRFLTKPEAVTAYRKAILGTSIYGHGSDYVLRAVINWHMLLYVYVSLHEEIYVFQISDVEVKAINE